MYYLKAIAIMKELNNNNDLIGPYLGLIRTLTGYNEIELYLNETQELIELYSSKSMLAYFYLTKGDILNKVEKYNESRIATVKAIEIAESVNYNGILAIAYLQLGIANYELKYYNDATSALKEALILEQHNIKNKFLILSYLSKSYAENGNIKNAFNISKEMFAVRDSLDILKNTEQFAEFNAKFKTAEKDKEITQQKLELSEQKSTQNKWIFGSLAFVLLGFTVFQWRNNKQKRQKLLAETKYQNQQEINELRTKFLGNIAHEIRTPLTLISGNLNLALENFDNKDKAKH